MTKSFWIVLLPFMLSTLFSGNVKSQDTLLVFPSAKEVDVIVTSEIDKTDNYFTYNYSLVSTDLSEQNVDAFYLELYSDSIKQVTAPQMWLGSQSDVRKKIILWGSRRSEFDIVPTGELDGFSIKVVHPHLLFHTMFPDA